MPIAPADQILNLAREETDEDNRAKYSPPPDEGAPPPEGGPIRPLGMPCGLLSIAERVTGQHPVLHWRWRMETRSAVANAKGWQCVGRRTGRTRHIRSVHSGGLVVARRPCQPAQMTGVASKKTSGAPGSLPTAVNRISS